MDFIASVCELREGILLASVSVYVRTFSSLSRF